MCRNMNLWCSTLHLEIRGHWFQTQSRFFAPHDNLRHFYKYRHSFRRRSFQQIQELWFRSGVFAAFLRDVGADELLSKFLQRVGSAGSRTRRFGRHFFRRKKRARTRKKERFSFSTKVVFCFFRWWIRLLFKKRSLGVGLCDCWVIEIVIFFKRKTARLVRVSK